MLDNIYEIFWDERWWFPNTVHGKHYGWKDLENQTDSDIYYPKLSDLHWGFLLGVVLVFVRFIFERYLVTPLGYKLGIKKHRVPYLTPNPLLEAAYKQRKQSPDYESLSKQTDWSVRQVEVWFRKRKKHDATPTIKKFCESSWQLLFYATSFIYGLSVLWHKPWFTRTTEWWTDWPLQHISNDIYVYYIIELAFYWGLIFTLVTDHRRSDFTQMMIHHSATIVLLYFSWIGNMVRVGTIVLILHDVADPWLAFAKLGIYLKWKTFTDVLFGIFVLSWLISRIFLLPYTVLYSTTFEVLEIIDAPYFANYFFNFFLYLLMGLTLIWTYHILMSVVIKFSQGEVKDSRSDIDDDSSEEIQESSNGSHGNGNTTNGSHRKHTNSTNGTMSNGVVT
ncbi:Ceramide synthase 5 [Mactra antiquata]